MSNPASAAKRVGVVGATLALLVAASCTSNAASSGPTAAVACRNYYEAIAAYASTCDASADRGDEARLILSCQLVLGAPGAASAASGIDACASVTRDATASCGATDVGACTGSPKGTLAAGAPCGVDVQCQGGYCKGAGISGSSSAAGTTTTVTCGVCVDRVAVGQPCDPQARNCADGATCEAVAADGGGFASGGGICTAVPSGDVGGSCQPPAHCKSNLRCDAATSTCAALSGAGGVCRFQGDCASPLTCVGGACAQGKAAGEACAGSGCARSLVCDSASGKCKALALAGPGAPCDVNFGSCKVGVCNIDTGSTGTCPAIIADGQPCTQPMNGTTCDTQAYCIAGKCQLFDPAACK